MLNCRFFHSINFYSSLAAAAAPCRDTRLELQIVCAAHSSKTIKNQPNERTEEKKKAAYKSIHKKYKKYDNKEKNCRVESRTFESRMECT